MNIPLDEVVYFDVTTHNPSTGAVSDADATPTFEVFEEATDTDIGVGGNLTKRTSKTGDYRGTFTASAANGFEVGKWYSVIASATVNSIAGKTRALLFRVVAAEAAAGYSSVRATDSSGNALATTSGVDQVRAVAETIGDQTAPTWRDEDATELVLRGYAKRLTVWLDQWEDNGVTYIADGGAGATVPVALYRPSTDDLGKTGRRAYQIRDKVRGFDVAAPNGGTNQRIVITFRSEVAGEAVIGIRGMTLSTDTGSTLRYGRLSTLLATLDLPEYVKATMNGDDSPSNHRLLPYFINMDIGPFRDNNAGNVFKEYWFHDTSQRQRFTVNVGENVLTIQGNNNLSQGFVVEGVSLQLITQPSDLNIPPFLPGDISFGTAEARASIETAAAAGIATIVMIGDSFTVRASGVALYERRAFEAEYGQGGLWQQLNPGGVSTTGLDTADLSTTEWATSDAADATVTLAGGGAINFMNENVRGYGYSTGQTGTVTFTFTGTDFKVIWAEKTSGGGSFTYSIDGGSASSPISTAGTDGEFGITSVTGLTNASHTVVLTKSGAGAVEFAFIGTGTHGVWGCRISRSGYGPDDHFPTNQLASWTSLLTALDPAVIIYQSVNVVFSSTGGQSDLTEQVPYLDAAIEVMAAIAPVTLAELTPFSAGTLAVSSTSIPFSGIATAHFWNDVFLLARNGRLTERVGFVSAPRRWGHEKTEATMYAASGYGTQDSNSIDDFHPSAVGAAMIGGELARQIINAPRRLADADVAAVRESFEPQMTRTDVMLSSRASEELLGEVGDDAAQASSRAGDNGEAIAELQTTANEIASDAASVETRLTAERAAKLDNIQATGSVATVSDLSGVGGSATEAKQDQLIALFQAGLPDVTPGQQRGNREIIQYETIGPSARPEVINKHKNANWPDDLDEFDWELLTEIHPDNENAGDALAGIVTVVTATGASQAVELEITYEESGNAAIGQHLYWIKGTKISEPTIKRYLEVGTYTVHAGPSA